MNVRYRVDLSQSEREELGALVSGGKQPVRRLKRMQILLAADAIVAAKETDTVFLNRFGPGPALRALRTVKTGAFEKQAPENIMAEMRNALRSISAATWNPRSPWPARARVASIR